MMSGDCHAARQAAVSADDGAAAMLFRMPCAITRVPYPSRRRVMTLRASFKNIHMLLLTRVIMPLAHYASEGAWDARENGPPIPLMAYAYLLPMTLAAIASMRLHLLRSAAMAARGL